MFERPPKTVADDRGETRTVVRDRTPEMTHSMQRKLKYEAGRQYGLSDWFAILQTGWLSAVTWLDFKVCAETERKLTLR